MIDAVLVPPDHDRADLGAPGSMIDTRKGKG
jgi:hypothetical protein